MDNQTFEYIETLATDENFFEIIVDLKVWETKFRSLMSKPAWQSLLNESVDRDEIFNPHFVRWSGANEGNVAVENDRVERHTYFKFMTLLCKVCEGSDHYMSYGPRINRFGNEYRAFSDGCTFYNNTDQFLNKVIIDNKGRVYMEVKNDNEGHRTLSLKRRPDHDDKNNPRKYVHCNNPRFAEENTFFDILHGRNTPVA